MEIKLRITANLSMKIGDSFMFKPKGLSYFEIDISYADTLFYTTDDQVEKAIIELLSERSDSQIRYTYNSHETVWSIHENIHKNKLKQLQNYGN